jgi:rfaE bifunctional protein nucleotidyltransferase chain/domain
MLLPMKTNDFKDKIKSLNEALPLVAHWKSLGETIVFTNGCFDILHAGHVSYLYDAKRLGDRLIIGINSDASIKKLKGHNRPVVSQKEREIVLAGLGCSDLIISFNEDTPHNLIEAIKPAIHVKGGDYTCEKLAEYPLVTGYGGKVIILPFYPGMSTTSIITKIMETYNHDT